MNREPNKEIDILLRKLSGKPNGGFTADGNSSASAHEHLDADELNAYAEHALPESLRARYTEHLADCGRCRTIVTQLSLSTTAIPAREAVAERSPSWLNTFLASLISPFVIRYAVPAMAVIMIAALGWIVLRREAPTQDVAQNIPSTAVQKETVQPSGSPAAPSSVESSAAAPARTTAGQLDPETTANKVEAKQPANKTPGDVAQEPAPVTATESKAAGDEKKLADVAAKRDAAATGTGNTAAPAGGAAAAPPPKETVTRADSNEPTQKRSEDVAKYQSNERRVYDEVQRSGPSNTQRARNQEAQPGAVQTSRGARTMSSVEGKDKDKANEEASEVRTVGGHRFTKRGQVWVDSLYNSNRSIVNVARGSEQYRSLMGDEPDLRAIVEQLSGEIIVVWKSRAYRFK